jgi:hypothetical protein
LCFVQFRFGCLTSRSFYLTKKLSVSLCVFVRRFIPEQLIPLLAGLSSVYVSGRFSAASRLGSRLSRLLRRRG